MTVQELCDRLELEVVTAGDTERVVTGGYTGDLLSWVMGRAKPGCAWVTIMQNANVAAVAVLSDAACVILAENVSPDDLLKTKAKSQDVALLRSPLPAYELCCRIGSALGA